MKKIWDRKDLCPFCFLEISHFARHILRKHQNEVEVQNIMKFDKKDPNRKAIFDALRKQGNFTLMTEKGTFCPVRRPPVNEKLHSKSEEYTPCSFCLGLYKANSLFRHSKTCKSKPENVDGRTRSNPVGDSQTLLEVHYGAHSSFLVKSRLKREVFPIMVADDIAKTAKLDPLICIYGECYLGKHKRRQMATKVSNEIREFGRLLLTMKKITPVQSMIEVLRPDLFDSVVQAVKIISGYDTEKKCFKSPSLVLHMRTNLFHLCSVAEKVILQRHKLFLDQNNDTKLQQIRDFKTLVKEHFATELSSLALKDLNEKKWQKPNGIPKTEDLEKFQKFVKSQAEEAVLHLQEDLNNPYYYSMLVKAALALLTAINRKRIGEVQYLTIETYNKDFSTLNLKEFQKTLSKHEVELASKVKRVVTGGKGSRPVPILFPKRLENYVDLILKVRDHTDIVPKTNPYVFALPNSKDRWISGYHVVRKLAVESKIDNPGLMTSTRFRKHLATVMQLLNYEKDEMEQIARFMGHNMRTHEQFYR